MTLRVSTRYYEYGRYNGDFGIRLAQEQYLVHMFMLKQHQ